LTPDELSAMREMVLDLARRMRMACTAQLTKLSPQGERPELALLPNVDESLTFPEDFDLSNPNSLNEWKAAVTDQAFHKGHEEGKQEGLIEGLRRGREEGRAEGREEGIRIGEARGRERGRTEGREEGIRVGVERGREEGITVGEARGVERGRLEERARAVVEVLRHRGVATTSQQEERLLVCRDGDTLERWWARVWTVASVDELFG
jgi:flagellar biosynthesis/type III secretory pathway protein FliH